MNRTRFPRSSRQPRISKARFRPQLDFLEDRVLLTRAVFDVVGTGSELRLSGTVGGVPIQQQGVSSLVGEYRGTIEVDYDVTAGTMRFLPLGSSVTALDINNWQPLPNGMPGQAPASYGGRVLLFGDMAYGAMRNLTFTTLLLTVRSCWGWFSGKGEVSRLEG